jgi:hypothetical protein
MRKSREHGRLIRTWRPRGYRVSPLAYVLSVSGAALMLLGISVLRSLAVVFGGLSIIVVGAVVARRSS